MLSTFSLTCRILRRPVRLGRGRTESISPTSARESVGEEGYAVRRKLAVLVVGIGMMLSSACVVSDAQGGILFFFNGFAFLEHPSGREYLILCKDMKFEIQSQNGNLDEEALTHSVQVKCNLIFELVDDDEAVPVKGTLDGSVKCDFAGNVRSANIRFRDETNRVPASGFSEFKGNDVECGFDSDLASVQIPGGFERVQQAIKSARKN
jgi:hypothetical protein